MAAMQRMLRPQVQPDMQAIRRRALRRRAPRNDSAGRGLVVVAHLVSLLSVGVLVIGLTFGSIALAKRCIGPAAASGAAATPTDDRGGPRADTTEAATGLPR